MKKYYLFNCTQQELYLVSKLGWELCRDNLQLFTKHKARYTAAFIDERLVEIAAAEQIPTDKTRKDKPKEDRIQNMGAADECMDMFQALKTYIADAFEPNLVDSKLEAAGQSYYLKAQAYNKDAINNLNLTATQFISNNLAALKADDNMPDTFLQEYLDAKQAYDETLMSYINSNKSSQDMTDANRDANNDIYTKLMRMLRDGQVIFKKDKVVRQQFTFSNLLASAGKFIKTRLRGTVTAADSGNALPNVTVTVQGKRVSGLTDKAGKYDVVQLAGGTYTVVFSAEGYQDCIVERVLIETGVVNRLDVVMQNVLVLHT